MLPHEIGHALLAARYSPKRVSKERYGTSLPDWIDEATAIWAEPDSLRTSRLNTALRMSDQQLNLSTILNTDHPAAGQLKESSLTSSAISVTKRSKCRAAADPDFCLDRRPCTDTIVVQEKTKNGITLSSDTLQSGTEELKRFFSMRDFYPQSFALMSFVMEIGGERAPAEIVARAVRGQSGIPLLINAGRLGQDSVALVREWKSWLERQRHR